MKTLNAAAITLLLSTTAASATTFNYTSFSETLPSIITIKPPSAPAHEVTAGQIVLKNAFETLKTWCIDIGTHLLPSGTYTITPPPPTLSATQIGEVGALIQYGDANITAPNVSGATQLAIWETIYNPLGYTFTTSHAVESETTTLLSMPLPPDPNWSSLTSGDNQGLATTINEPAALGLIGLSLVAIWAIQRRRNAVSKVS